MRTDKIDIFSDTNCITFFFAIRVKEKEILISLKGEYT